MNNNAKHLTWPEIKAKYPHQNVGLTDIKKGADGVSIETAIVSYTDKDKTYAELLIMASKGEIDMRYTTLDEDDGVI